MEMKTYSGIRPTDPGGRNGIRNPERGFRIESVFAELPGVEYSLRYAILVLFILC